MGKRAQAILEQKEQSPQNAEEFLEQGAADEESGDRWFGSDVTKALRFYQKAYELYLACIRMAPGQFPDSYYNAARLLFHVYNHYVSAEEVNVETLENVGNATSGNAESVMQPIAVVLRAHEEALRFAGLTPSIDLIYNYALVHTAFLEDEDPSLPDTLSYGSAAIQLFQQVLTRQVEELTSFAAEIKELVSPELSSTTDVTEPNVIPDASLSGISPTKEEHTSEEVLQPVDVLDTVVAAYKLALAMVECTISSDISPVVDIVQPFLESCDTIASELMTSFSISTNQTPEMISSIEPENYDEYAVNRAFLHSFAHIDDAATYINYWNQDSLPRTPDRYMLSADGLGLFLERHSLNVKLAHADQAATLWKCLSQMNTYYKSAQDLLQAQYLQKAKAPSGTNEGLGSLISQVCKVTIARADIEVQRCQLDQELARKSREVLLKNAKTLLKNAMKMAETTGGLREKATEKLGREKRRSEIVLRLCLLEQKISTTELDSIMGRTRWTAELPLLKELDIYGNWGIHKIVT